MIASLQRERDTSFTRAAALAIDATRLMGLAFATADLVFEADATGRILFAAGAGRRVCGVEDSRLEGEDWRTLVGEHDRALAETLAEGADDGARRGPVAVRLASGSGYAQFSVFRLPGNAGRISCALALTPAPGSTWRFEGELMTRDLFEATAQDLLEQTGSDQELELSLVRIRGLAALRANLEGAPREALEQRMAGAMRAEAAYDAASDLGDGQFALIRQAGEPAGALTRRLSRVLGAAAQPSTLSLKLERGPDAGPMLRALRFAVDSFTTNESALSGCESLGDVLDHSLEHALNRAGAFGALVHDRRFRLLFQPVVSLADGSVHHHEVLVRFKDDESPFPMIRMAEELDIIESLDRAVTEDAVRRLSAPAGRGLSLAVNLSGRTIVNPQFLHWLRRLVADAPVSGRLLFEVTESAAIEDLTVAQTHVAALQALGFKVCLDDFGAGAASYGYLQQLSVDVVKIDGAYVRTLATSGRDSAMLRHMVSLCRDLKITTIAEMVETEAVADALRKAGVDYGQGWLFGPPSAEPADPGRRGLAPRRRAGAADEWR